ncbi:MAG: DUF2721 domain-containing protein [Sphingomonas sp.]|nr:DUF2721 domain-containing protein [Sphingomonas sp.]RZV52577.1 MAG: DUF2721 domain-containing protein [Sphingomonadaceae bacterium]
MFVDLTANLASELITRTSETARVQQMVQLSLAPVFLLAAIGAVLNVMNVRLIWIVDRVSAIEAGTAEDRAHEELAALRRRQKFASLAITFSSVAALIICLVIALMFISAFVRPAMGTLVAICWVGAMLLVIGSLIFFMRETQIAAASAKERRALSRAIEKQLDEQEG